jgi:uncharacterized protein (DUF58 family)
MLHDRATRTFLDSGMLSRLAAVPLLARRPMVGGVSGRHTSPHRGASVEFAEYRKYVPGDDLRRLDWRVWGRTDRNYVKEYEADTNLRLCLVVDSSGSMNYGSTGTTRIEFARRIAGTLAFLACRQGDAVGISCVAESVVRHLPPRRNPAHLRLVLDALEEVRPQGASHLPQVLHEIAETVRQRALIVILSDLFMEPEALAGALGHLRFRRHDVALFHLLDPQEIRFDFRRPTRFLDMEGGSALFADPLDIQARYRQALEAWLDAIRGIVLEQGIDHHQVSLDDDCEKLLARFLVGRATGRGRR